MRAILLAFVATAVVTLSAQAPKTSRVLHAPDGRPDLQGIWDFAQLTPFERPGAFAGKDTLSEEEAEEFAQQRVETQQGRGATAAPRRTSTRAYKDFIGGTAARASPSSRRSSSIRRTAGCRR